MVRYQKSYSGLGELMNSPEMAEVMRQVAEKGKAYAEGIAPVGIPPEDEHPGNYRDSFEVNVQSHGGLRGDRAAAQIINTSDYAAALEWGNGSFPPYSHGYHVLARTAQALGSL